jgi:hypothetical protein
LLVRLLYHQGPINWDGFEIKTGHSHRATQGILDRLKKQYITDVDKNNAEASVPRTPKKGASNDSEASKKPATPKLSKEEQAAKKLEREQARAKKESEKAAKEAEKVAKVRMAQGVGCLYFQSNVSICLRTTQRSY